MYPNLLRGEKQGGFLDSLMASANMVGTAFSAVFILTLGLHLGAWSKKDKNAVCRNL
jgi:hypothetical protein